MNFWIQIKNVKKVSVKINLKKVIVPKFWHYYFFPFSHRYYFEICVNRGKSSVCFDFFWFFILFFGFFMLFWTFFDLGIHLKHLQLHSSIPMLECNFMQIFSGSEPAGVKKHLYTLEWIAILVAVAAMNAAKTADQQSVPNKKRFFFGLFRLFGFLCFFWFYSFFWT